MSCNHARASILATLGWSERAESPHLLNPRSTLSRPHADWGAICRWWTLLSYRGLDKRDCAISAHNLEPETYASGESIGGSAVLESDCSPELRRLSVYSKDGLHPLAIPSVRLSLHPYLIRRISYYLDGESPGLSQNCVPRLSEMLRMVSSSTCRSKVDEKELHADQWREKHLLQSHCRILEYLNHGLAFPQKKDTRGCQRFHMGLSLQFV